MATKKITKKKTLKRDFDVSHPPGSAETSEPTPNTETFETDISHPKSPPDSATTVEPASKKEKFETDDDDSSLFLDATLSSNWVDKKVSFPMGI